MHATTRQRVQENTAGAPLGFVFGNPARARYFASLYLGFYPLWCQRLERAMNNADYELLRKVAYDVRGCCMIMSVSACVEQARQLQMFEPDGATRDARLLCARLEETLDALAGEMRRLVAKGADADAEA